RARSCRACSPAAASRSRQFLDLERLDRRLAAFEVERAERRRAHALARRGDHGLRADDLTGLRLRLQTRGDVHGVADGGEVLVLIAAEVPTIASPVWTPTP